MQFSWPVRYRDDYWIEKMREQMLAGKYWIPNSLGCFLLLLLFLALIAVALFQSCLMHP